MSTPQYMRLCSNPLNNPKCRKIVSYKSELSYKTAEKNKTVCGSCSRYGKQREPFSEEWKNKIGEASKKRVCSDSTREKISNVHKGKKISIEVRKAISDTLKGRSLSEEVKQRISLSLIGKKRGPFSEEHKRKLSISQRGKRKPLSEEH